MNKVKIVGVGEFLPGPQITNEKMESIFGLKKEWIEIVLGNEGRHFGINLDENKVEYNLVDGCQIAAERAIKHAGIDKEEIDLVILSTATPDNLMPTSVNMVAEKLGLDRITTFQIQSGCAGCVQAFQLAHTLLREGSYRKALVLSGDTSYKFIDLSRDFSSLAPSELVNYALFGDGAGASILSSSNELPGLEIISIVNRLEGIDKKPGHILPWEATNGNKHLLSDGQGSSEDYKAIETNVPVMTKELIDELLETESLSLDEIEFYLPPQLAGKITDSIISHCNLDKAKCISRVRQVGNTGNSTPYFQLVDVWDKLRKGDKVMLTAIESSKWIKTGMLLTYN